MSRFFVLAVMLTGAAVFVPVSAQQAENEQPVDSTVKQEPAEAVQIEPEFTVDEMICGISVMERELEGAAETFPAGTEKVYCWTLITGCEEPTTVEHVWYYGAEEMARVTLDVKYPRVRTWSSKNILPEWTGDWKVELVDADGNILATRAFSIE